MSTVQYEDRFNEGDDDQELFQGMVEILKSYAPKSPPAPIFTPAPSPPFKVFIGHGGDNQWRILRDSLRDHHGFEIEAFEGCPRAGETISNVLAKMARASSVALLVLTGTDQMADKTVRGRQNVVHEIGYFQGILGWQNAIVLLEDGVDEFSNLAGTQQVRFPKGNIEAAVGQVVAELNNRRQPQDNRTSRRG